MVLFDLVYQVKKKTITILLAFCQQIFNFNRYKDSYTHLLLIDVEISRVWLGKKLSRRLSHSGSFPEFA